MKKRSFLAGASALALIRTMPPAEAAFFGGANLGPSSFQGNPNVTVTAIDTSGGIVKSRSGALDTPAFLMVSASSITATGTSRPYEDLEYFWDFGDPAGRETFTNPVTGLRVNANIHQYGPEAAYCYRAAGTYRITLHARGKNGSAFVTAVATTSVTIEAFTPTNGIWYFDQNATGANNGTSAADAFTLMSGATVDVTNLTSKLGAVGSDLRFARGSYWNKSVTATSLITITKSNLRMSAYTPASGALANPRFGIIGTNGNENVCNIQPGTASIDNIVISDIDMVANTKSNATLTGQQGATIGETWSNIFIDHGSYTAAADNTTALTVMYIRPEATNLPGGAAMQNVGWWGCTIASLIPLATTTLVGVDNYGAQVWCFRVGCTVSGDCNHNPGNTHTCNCETTDSHVLFRWYTLSGRADGLAMNCNAHGFISGLSQYYLITDFDISNSGANSVGGIDLSNTQTDAGDIYTVQGISVAGSNPWVVTVTGTVPSTYSGGSAAVEIFGMTPASFNASARITNVSAGAPGSFKYSLNFDPGSYVSGGQYSTGRFRNFVIQSGNLHDIGSSVITFPTAIETLTMRFINVWACPGANFLTPNNTMKTVLAASAYGNKIYLPAGTAAAVFGFQAAGWTQAQQITDNIVYDARVSTARIVAILVSELVGAGSIIDRNQYWYPSSTKPFENQSPFATKTLPEWKALNAALDPNSVNSNPGWIDPANGNFNT